MKLKFENALIFLASISIAPNRQCRGTEVDLAKSCNGLKSCVLHDITATYTDPFVISENSTQSELHELVIRDTGLLRFPREIFERARNLHAFVVHNCGLNRIGQSDFQYATNLIALVLQRNRLSEIGEEVFSPLTSLKELRLGQNNIHLVHQEAFARLTSLTHLDLQQNAINHLGENVFSPLSNLEYLDLSWNEIAKIDAATFAANPKLTTLLLNNNKFIVFEPNSLEHLPHLHLLDVSNSFLEELNTQSVDTLYADNSSLKRCNIHGGVVRLHANNNELTELMVQNPAAVRELQLHGNHFESLDPFVDMMNLQHLDAAKNLISTLANSRSSLFLSLPSLEYLNLSFNKLKNLTNEQFLLMPRLTHLDIAFNHLVRIDSDVFRPLRRLEKLFIDGNGLHFFEYKKFLDAHGLMQEMGINANAWDWALMQEMIEYMESCFVRVAQRYPASLREMSSQLSISSSSKLQKGSSSATKISAMHPDVCQCFSPNQEVLTISILCLISLIVVLQVWLVTRAINCSLPFGRLRSTVRFGRQFDPESLDESVSQV